MRCRSGFERSDEYISLNPGTRNEGFQYLDRVDAIHDMPLEYWRKESP